MCFITHLSLLSVLQDKDCEVRTEDGSLIHFNKSESHSPIPVLQIGEKMISLASKQKVCQAP